MSKRKEERGELIKIARNTPIEIPIFEREELFKMAIKHHNTFCFNRNKYDKILHTPPSDKTFLARLALNMLRHTNRLYDITIKEFGYGEEAKRAHDILKDRLNRKIAKVYPFLKKAIYAHLAYEKKIAMLMA